MLPNHGYDWSPKAIAAAFERDTGCALPDSKVSHVAMQLGLDYRLRERKEGGEPSLLVRCYPAEVYPRLFGELLRYSQERSERDPLFRAPRAGAKPQSLIHALAGEHAGG